MNSPSPAGDLPSSSSEAPAAAPLASAPAAPPELNGERAPLDIGLDVMVTSEGLEAREALPQIHDAQPRRHTFRRRVRTPLILFLVTSLSTWFAGATLWMPLHYLLGEIAWAPIVYDGFVVFYYPVQISFMELRQVLYVHWFDGLMYMACVQLILFAHEMGHFLYAVYYRVRCTLPYFIPLPIAPTGTMGAVIAMEGHKANRPQIFDIGIAGPIAGLCLAVPILWLGVRDLNLDLPAGGGFALDLPLAIRWLVDQAHPGKLGETNHVWLSQANPCFIAGWFGLFMTALNMMPVSQLDGGHITYTLWGKGAHWVARGFMVLVFAYIAFTGNPNFGLMAMLVMLIGTDHPPTSDDKAPIGTFRTLLGYASLTIPIVCISPKIIVLQ
jgi:hypothetical protein